MTLGIEDPYSTLVKKPFVVTVLNQKLTVASDSDETHVNSVGQLVNDRVEAIMAQSKSVSTLNAALLTCLNLADELLSLKGAQQQKLDWLRSRVVGLVSQVDEKIKKIA